MRVFVTGASGWIGSALVPELLAKGHQVLGLARSDPSAERLAAAGAEVLRGSLGDLESLRRGARDTDGTVHLAYIHDFSQFEENARIDVRAIDAMGEELAGSGRPFLIASGTLGLAPGRLATETDMPDTTTAMGGRGIAAEHVLALADRGVRSAVVRLPPTVHGAGDHGFVAALVATARGKGVAAYIGDGAQRWPAVHCLDAAVLFRLALEQAPAASVLHATADEGVPIRTIAEILGRHLGVPAVSIPREEAMAHFGWLANALAVDSPASSALTRERFGWTPTHPGLVEDLEAGHYFRG
ncbi:MAG TPA: SDR family oxidoreductase [Amnibacterium sp.]|jgi:nucleoside-diphosphate-sugar epimerase|uniref:SDR family oxidoreductase n=1 Tax=Amnibacterium sp. TaxID=1872496 RepID=UPI002F94F266